MPSPEARVGTYLLPQVSEIVGRVVKRVTLPSIRQQELGILATDLVRNGIPFCIAWRRGLIVLVVPRESNTNPGLRLAALHAAGFGDEVRRDRIRVDFALASGRNGRPDITTLGRDFSGLEIIDDGNWPSTTTVPSRQLA